MLYIFSSFVQFVLENVVFNQIHYSKSFFLIVITPLLYTFILIIYYLHILSLCGYTFLVHKIAILQLMCHFLIFSFTS